MNEEKIIKLAKLFLLGYDFEKYGLIKDEIVVWGRIINIYFTHEYNNHEKNVIKLEIHSFNKEIERLNIDTWRFTPIMGETKRGMFLEQLNDDNNEYMDGLINDF